MAAAGRIKFGDNLTVTDEGAGVIRVDASGAGAAEDTTFEPAGGLVSTDVQAALEELDARPTSGGYIGYIRLLDLKTEGSQGGTATSGSYETRVINTEDQDTNNDCSLASNQITLAAGIYDCRISVPAYSVYYSQTRLRNVTDSATVLIGTGTYDGGNSVETRSFIQGRFTIGASKALEIQHRVYTTKTTNGHGVAYNLGQSAIYTIAEFWRVS
jgi:hypothetical protein